jgi:hypothetical protein
MSKSVPVYSAHATPVRIVIYDNPCPNVTPRLRRLLYSSISAPSNVLRGDVSREPDKIPGSASAWLRPGWWDWQGTAAGSMLAPIALIKATLDRISRASSGQRKVACRESAGRNPSARQRCSHLARRSSRCWHDGLEWRGWRRRMRRLNFDSDLFGTCQPRRGVANARTNRNSA